ncbi:MAG TPA: zinc-ribbon domain-containing protein, partial [Rhodopila sp.]|uniref:zinc-ribbon domain-containing protein n=1 Tax=Rhodopila sp. TaxID=2480087 RepID=UPI002BE832BE
MKLFFCQHCGQLLYFDNVRCEKCGHRLGYLPSAMTLSALEPQGDAWHALADPSTQVRFCRNAEADGCNWLVEADSDLPFCAACRFNRTIPDLSDPVNM